MKDQLLAAIGFDSIFPHGMARMPQGPTFAPLSPAPLAPLASPERAPAVVSSEDAE